MSKLLDNLCRIWIYLTNDFIKHNGIDCSFKADESWVILSPIEQEIKRKIEKVGTHLKDWSIKINYGIKTGCNGKPEIDEGIFIISDKQRKELITQDPKSAEIIRPILRGRDIKKYGYNFADLWLINAHNGIKEKGIKPIDINDYPAIKRRLDKYYSELEKRQDKGDTTYNLRNCAYMDDFSRPKIVWIELVDRPNFALDETGIMINNTVFFITGNNIHFLLAYLNSTLCDWHFGKICATSGAGTRRWIKQYIEQIYAPIPNEKQNQDMKILIEKIDKASENLKMKLISEIDDKIFSLFNLSIEEKNFIKNSIP